MGIAIAAANGDTIRADCTQYQQRIDQEYNPGHGLPEPIPDFEQEEFFHKMGSV